MSHDAWRQRRLEQKERLAELGFAGRLTRSQGYPSRSECETAVREAVKALGDSPLWVGQDSPSQSYSWAEEMGLMDRETYERARLGMGRQFNYGGS